MMRLGQPFVVVQLLGQAYKLSDLSGFFSVRQPRSSEHAIGKRLSIITA